MLRKRRTTQPSDPPYWFFIIWTAIPLRNSPLFFPKNRFFKMHQNSMNELPAHSAWTLVKIKFSILALDAASSPDNGRWRNNCRSNCSVEFPIELSDVNIKMNKVQFGAKYGMQLVFFACYINSHDFNLEIRKINVVIAVTVENTKDGIWWNAVLHAVLFILLYSCTTATVFDERTI